MSLFGDNCSTNILPCKCRVYASNNVFSHTFNESWGNQKYGAVDILILTEFKEFSDRMEALNNFFSSYLNYYKWRMIPALGCTPAGMTLKQNSSQPYIECKKYNIDRLIRLASPEIIITIGRGLYTITGSGEFIPQHFYSLHEDDTWLYSPEYRCRVIPLPSSFLWIDWDVYERHFVKEQLKRAIKFLSLRKPRIPEITYHYEHDPDDLLEKLIDDKSIVWFGFDTETGGFNYFEDELYSFQLSWTGYHGVFIKFSDLRDKNLFIEFFNHKKIAMHNASFDLKFLWRNGIYNARCDFDTMLAAHAINENSPNGLKPLSWIYTYYGGYENHLRRYMDLNRIHDFRFLPEDILAEYGSIDACITLQLKNYFKRRLDEESDEVRKNFYELIMPAVPVVAEMEMNGIPVDVEYMYKYNDNLMRQKRRIEFILQKFAGPGENIRSGKVLSRIISSDPAFQLLRDEKGRPLIAKNGDLILNQETVPLYAEQGIKVAKYLVKYRQIVKTIASLGIEKLNQKSNGYDNLFGGCIIDSDESRAEDGWIASIRMIDDKYGTLHTGFNLAGTHTGRLSSGGGGLTANSRVNAQNFTKRKQDRLIFGSRWILAQYDYNAMEMRIASQVSGPGVLESLLMEGKDLHCYTLAKVLELRGEPESYDEIVYRAKKLGDEKYKKLRDQVKAVNFGAIYNIQAHTLASTLGVSIDDAQQFLDAFFESYPEYRRYMERQWKFVRKNGYVISLLGKKRRLPQLTYVGRDSDNREYLKKSNLNNLKNIAVNHPIQSTSGLTTLKAMLEISREWKSKNIQSKIVGNVHDAIWFLIKPEEAIYCHESIQRLMTQPYYENVNGNKVIHVCEAEFGPYGFGIKINNNDDIVNYINSLKEDS